jgi:hypothetical protein
MQVCPYLFHVGLAGIRRHVDDKTDLWKWHLDFFLQLRAATVESRFGMVMALKSTPCFFAHL